MLLLQMHRTRIETSQFGFQMSFTKSSGSSLGFSREHPSNDSPEEPGWGSEVEWASPGWLGAVLFVEEVFELESVSEEGARNVDFLGTHDNNFLSIQGLFGDDRSKSTKHVAFSVDDDEFLEHWSGLNDSWNYIRLIRSLLTFGPL